VRAPGFALAWGLALALLPAPAATEPDPPPPPELARALVAGLPQDLAERLHERGYVLLPGADADSVAAFVLFPRPPDAVFALLAQPERQAEFRSAFGALTLLGRQPDGWLEEQHVQILFVSFRYRLRWKVDAAARTLAWHIDPDFDNSIEHVSGSWELLALDADRTLGRFATRVRIGAALPRFVQARVTRRNVRQSLESTLAWVETDGRWRP
jgi:hypothetical protein